jgi:RNA polymerase sigma-70 factor, ECF subfamily
VSDARAPRTEDARLLREVKAGDGRAMARVIAAHGPPVYAFLRRMLGRDAAVDDLFQDVFLAFATHASELDDATNLHAWLLVVASNRFRSHRRWRLVDPTRWLVLETPVDTDENQLQDAYTPESDLAERQRAKDLETAVARLDEGDRAVMLLHLDDALTPAERAQALGVTDAAYRKRLERARKRFSEQLKRLEGGRP